MKAQPEREVYMDGKAVLPELPLVGRTLRTRALVPGLPAHVHSGVFEIFFIERGRVEWWVEKEAHRLSANQIYINRPGERHGSTGHGLRPCGYYWIQLTFPRGRLPGLSKKESDVIRAALSDANPRCFAASRELKKCFHDLLELHRVRPPYHELSMRATLHLLLARLLLDRGNHASQRAPERKPSFAIRKAMNAIEANPSKIKTIPDLARLSGLHVTQFSDRFFAEAGFTPAAYLRQQRIEQAKQLLLEKHHTLTDVALATGFCSSQHFATVFKQVEGMTPRDFIANHRQ